MKNEQEPARDESINNESANNESAKNQPEATSPIENDSSETSANESELQAAEQIGQDSDGGPAMPTDEEIVHAPNISLSPEQAAALSKWIITQSTGIHSAEGADDHPKAALLMLLKAVAYEEDMFKREDIFLSVEKAVFRYTFAADNEMSRFMQRGLDNLDAMVDRANWGKE